MKSKFDILVIALLSICSPAVAQNTAFTYQGLLNTNNNPANGRFDLRFTLFEVESGGTARIPPFETNGVRVSNGLFTVVLDYGLTLGAAPRWLQVEVRPGGGGVYSTLSPRQLLTPTPKAHYANQAGDVLNLVPDALIPSTVPRLTGSNAFTGPIHFEGQGRPARPPFTVGNSELITNLNADLLDGLHAAGFWQLSGNAGTTPGAHYLGTSDAQPLELRANFQVGLRLEPGVNNADLRAPGNLSFGTQTRQMLNLWGTDYGIGVQSSTVYFRTGPGSLFTGPGGNFTWFAGGQHSDTAFDPGLPRVLFDTSKELMRLEGDGQLSVFGSGRNGVQGYSGLGNGVQGNSGSSAASGVYGQSDAGGFGVAGRTTGSGSAIYGDNTDATGWAGNFNGRVSVSGNQHFGAQTRQMLNLWGTQYGIGVQGETLYFRTDNTFNGAFCWYKGGTHSDTPREAGGGTRLMCLSDIFLLLYVDLQSSANCSFAGEGYFGRDLSCRTLTQRSDRESKENFSTVDCRQVLNKVSTLPVASWNFKDAPGVRHVGPTAQDFHAAFCLGSDDKHIAAVDADGVALAAIQGLNQKVDELKDELKRSDAENTRLKRRLEALEKAIHDQKSN